MKFSDQHKKTLSIARRKWCHSAETKAKMSASHKGMKRSEETRKKISAGHKGKKQKRVWCHGCGKEGGWNSMHAMHCITKHCLGRRGKCCPGCDLDK